MLALRNCISFIVAFLLVTAIAGASHAAWTRAKGEALWIQNASYYSTHHYIDNDGNASDQPQFSKYELNGYGEYGLRDDWTLGINTFLHRLTADRSPPQQGSDSNVGLADVELFARHRLWHNDNAVLSVQPLLKFPSYYRKEQNPRSGTDDWDAELRLQGGYGFDFWDRHHFAVLELAYRARGGDWKDQLKMDATLGLAVNERWLLLPQVFVTQRAEGETPNAFVSSGVNDYDLVKGQLSVVYQWDDATNLQLGAFSHLRARNTGDGEGILFSIWRRF